MQKKIKIYSDKKYLTQNNYEPILFPFWGISNEEKNNQFQGAFDEYIKNGKNYFEMTSIEDCDYVILPEKYDKNKMELMQPLISLAEKYNKPIIIFYINDSSEDINIKNAYIFRTSFYKQTKKNNEFAMPVWVEDFNAKYFNKKLLIRKKQNIPTVSYCGYTKTWKDRVKYFIGKDYGIWREIRYKAVKILQQNKGLRTNFIIRKSFWGGAFDLKNNNIKEQELENIRLKIHNEYIANLVKGDYALVTRGNGNFSIRFYEVLSMGRIPVFINTDCVLPYDEYIKWKNLCVWVEDHEINNTAEKIIDFHNNISDQDFEDLQKIIYQTYTEWISPNGFFKNFHKHLPKK